MWRSQPTPHVLCAPRRLRVPSLIRVPSPRQRPWSCRALVANTRRSRISTTRMAVLRWKRSRRLISCRFNPGENMSELVEQHATTADTGEQRKTPVIDPTNVREQVKGLCWFEWQVRLPQGTTFQDLNDPTIWRLVQLNKNTALSRLDRVRIIPYDEAWIAEAVVASAPQFGVSLTKPVKIDLPVRDQVLFE